MMKKLLFVCTINKMRSLTAEHIFKNDTRFLVSSAGTDISATKVIDSELLAWADYILVMEKRHRNIIRQKFPDVYKNKTIICLYIDDNYAFMDTELIHLLQQRLEENITKGLIKL